jgi:hypothetical protein
MAPDSPAAAALLKRQLRDMQTSKDIPGISCGLVNDSNMFEWEVMLMISDDCKYYGGTLFSCPAFSGSISNYPASSLVLPSLDSLLEAKLIRSLITRRKFPCPPPLPTRIPPSSSVPHLSRTRHSLPPKHLPRRPPLHLDSTPARGRRDRLRGRF